MTRRALAYALALCLALSALLPISAAATDLPLPDSMAAVGDSITQAASSGGGLGTDYPQNSWATGTTASVNSHYLRLLAAGAPISGRNHNLSVSGAKMADLNAQMASAVPLQPDYLTVLIGGNDLCTPTEAQMTPVDTFRSQLQAAMATLSTGSPETNIYVVSVPRALGLWELFRNSWWARFIWSIGNVCQSLLANPLSTDPADVDRRARVAARNVAYNDVLAEVCAATPRCLWDGYAAYNTQFVAADVAGDYFHPSLAGQAKLASVSWAAGYTWVVTPPPNVPPEASFTHACSSLTCTFTDTSTDSDGSVVAWAWDFGDGGTSSDQSPSHPYATAGSYPVSLTVTDNGGAPGTTQTTVTVSAPAAAMRVSDLSGSGAIVSKTNWRATVTVTVTTTAGAPVANATVAGSWSVGAGDTCVTNSAGTCSATSDNLRRSRYAGVTFTVTGVSHATLPYDPAQNVESSITIPRP